MTVDSRGRADLWLAQESDEPEIALVGLPWSEHSKGVALTPMILRDRLGRFSTYHSERDIDFGGLAAFDAGNWPIAAVAKADLAEYLGARWPLLPDNRLTLFVGGGRELTGELLVAAGDPKPDLIAFSCRPPDQSAAADRDSVHIGAHTFAASASTVAGAARAGAISIPVQQIEKEGVRMTIDRAVGKLSMSERIHVSVDLDALDPIYAPGSPTALPGGMGIRDLSDAVRLCCAKGKVRSVSFVGADAEMDGSATTLDAVCHLLLSAVAGYAERGFAP